MQQDKSLNILKNINITIGSLVLLSNLPAFILCGSNKINFVLISIFLNICLFFLHGFLIIKESKKNINEIKKEALYINYPLNIATFMFCIFLIFVFSIISLYIINSDALNPAFIFTYFINILSLLFPSILVLAYICFIFPAFILPGMSANKRDSQSTEYLIIFFIIFLILSGFRLISYSVKTINIDKQDKYKIVKLPFLYSNQYLKIKNISEYGKKKLSYAKAIVPFAYTAESFNYNNYKDAENFCKSIGARVPNYIEMYNIAFNKFNLFGEDYYWTSNKDGAIPVLIHFKNMSYNVIKYNQNISPTLHCVANEEDNNNIFKKNHFYRNFDTPEENTMTLDQNYQKTEVKANDDIIVYSPDTEKKFVNFSVKEVSSDIMIDLIRKGYDYNPKLKINAKYETNEQNFAMRITPSASKKYIRLCYYPFTDYGNLSIENEAQIWKQSFCSPFVILLEPNAVMKSKSEADSYCIKKGGRLPNIPELNGILKTLNINKTGEKYWTNNKITDRTTKERKPVLVFYKDSRFMQIKVLDSKEQDNAYAFCITEPDFPSKIIANYKSRFKGIDGAPYAKAQCSSCYYYEVPDTVLLSY